MARAGLLAVAVALLLARSANAASLPPGQGAATLVFAVQGRGRIVQNRVGDDLSIVPALTLLNPSSGSMPGVVALVIGHDRTLVRVSHAATIRSVRMPGRLVLEVAVAAPTGAGARDRGSPPALDATGVLPGLPAPMIAVVDAPAQTAGQGPSPINASAQLAPRSEAPDPQAPDPQAPGSPAPGPKALASGALALPAPGIGAPASTALIADPGPSSSPMSIAATLVPATPDRPAGLLLPFDRTVGAAAFRRGGRLQVVFDARKPIDLAVSAGDPLFQRARLSLLPAGTLLDLPVEANQPVALMRVADGWLLSPTTPATQPAVPEAQADGLIFGMAGSGEVLTVADPAGGGELLVGTVQAGAHNVVATGKAPGYRIVPSILGVAVERLSDRVELRPFATGFRLIDPYPPRGDQADPSAAFSRGVALPSVEGAEQWRRYKTLLATSASLPPGSRRASRLNAARSALALGLGAEARMLSQAADEDAPNAADRSGSALLIGAGALLAGDADAARLLADPLIGNSDEATLWRNLAVGRQSPSDRPAARSVTALWPLLQAYPEPLRRQLLGDAALLLATGGDQAGRSLVAHLEKATGKAGLARALASEGADHDPAALAMLDRLYDDRDPDVSVSAALEATELRLRDHSIGPAEAARRAESLIYDGRMAGREQDVALRAAQLHVQAKQWQAAFTILRQQASSPGADLSKIRHLAGSMLVQAADAASAVGTGASAQQDTLRVINLLQQNQDLLPPEFDRIGLSTRLADRLAAHDLPGRATAFLRQAMAQSPVGTEKARLGVSLAAALLQQDDVVGAREAFDRVDRGLLPSAMTGQARLIDAKLRSAAGDRQGAIAILAPARDEDSVALRATLMADAKDWQGEASALATLLAVSMPGGPHGTPLDADMEDVVLRLAGALSRSGQRDTLRQLDRTWSPSFGDHAKRDMMSLLAAPDVTSVSDLPRSAGDISVAHRALRALGGGAG